MANTPEEIRRELFILTEEELASALGHRSTNTLQTWRSEGQGPRYVKLGKGVFYRKADLAEWIFNRSEVAAAAAAVGQKQAA